ncbi:MAG: hypothetical protein EOP47_29615, partial [Sphingobacteriaceae bacterium]
MKKLLLLVVAFLPVFVFGQANLVRWNGVSNGFTATVLNSNVSSSSMSNQGGVSLSNDGQYNQWFTMGNWPNPSQNSGGRDATKYIQYTITPNANYQIVLNDFKFRVRTQGGTANYQVLYSKDPAFLTGVYTLIPNTGITGSWANSPSNSLSSVNPVLPISGSSTVYIRFYAYNTYNAVQIEHSWGGTVGATISGTVSLTTPPAPVAVNDPVATAHNTAATINVLNNDTVNGLASTVAVVSGQGPTNGTVSVNSSTQIVTYTPANGFTGVDTFKYKVTNANGTSNEATVTVNVAPRANNDTASANQNVATAISVLTNDVTSGTATVNITQQPSNGSATVNGSGQIVYTSAGTFTGATTIKYTVTTTHGTSNEATVTVNVVPPVPVAVNDAANTLQNQAVTIN